MRRTFSTEPFRSRRYYNRAGRVSQSGQVAVAYKPRDANNDSNVRLASVRRRRRFVFCCFVCPKVNPYVYARIRSIYTCRCLASQTSLPRRDLCNSVDIYKQPFGIRTRYTMAGRHTAAAYTRIYIMRFCTAASAKSSYAHTTWAVVCVCACVCIKHICVYKCDTCIVCRYSR